jgi:hypothetical protein
LQKQTERTALLTKLQNARKEAVEAALAKDATGPNVKMKIDAVVTIMEEIWMLQYSKGFKVIANEVSDDQKNRLIDSMTGYGQIFGAPRAAR